MPACPAGHESSATDFCDVCGVRIGGQTLGSVSSLPASTRGGPAEPCPQCGTNRTGQFCEVCGLDFTTGKPARPGSQPASAQAPQPASAQAPQPASAQAPQPASAQAAQPPPTAATAAEEPGVSTGWKAVITADRAYFDSVVAAGGPDAATIQFSGYYPERQFRLSGKEMRIGRRSASRGLEPEIDLTGPPTDPGVSHLHAVLIAQPDGTWSVLDPGSSNGTQVNGTDIAAGVQVPLHDGDRICVGAWTMLTIHSG